MEKAPVTLEQGDTIGAGGANVSRESSSGSGATGMVIETDRSLWRAASLLVGATGLTVLCAWVPLLDRAGGQFVCKAVDDGRVVAILPNVLVAMVLAAAMIGGLGVLASLFQDPRLRRAFYWVRRWVGSHPGYGVFIFLAIAAGAIDWYELLYDPYNKKHGLRVWMLREDVQQWLSLGAAVMGALALSALVRDDEWRSASSKLLWSLRRQPVRWWAVGLLMPLMLAAGMSLYALEGIPHFSDSLTYLMQGRILHSGRLWVEAPLYPELFKHALFFIETDGRFYGKYPIGWPAILGMFDRLGMGYLANAAMVSLAALLTGLVARQFTPRRVAVLATVLFGLSPWVWFNGANFASHVASTCAVMAFVWLFLWTLREGRYTTALAAGLSLGAGVLIRPFDAAMFAIPAVVVVLAMQIRRPKQWIPLGTLVAVGALVGVAIYMWVNANTTGSATKSPYAIESRWDSDWNPTPLAAMGRLAFQWSELNGRFPGWGIGGITVTLIGAYAAGRRWRRGGLRLITASTAMFFIGCCAFGFTNVWWGPRWLVPVTPLLAILAAELVDRLLCQACRRRERGSGAWDSAALALGLVLAGMVVGLLGRYGGQYYQNLLMPPHKVSRAVYDQVRVKGVDQVVVAMPIDENRPPLDARAGIVFMDVPFEDNSVIYVRAIPDWPQQAIQCYPQRQLYEVIADPDDEKGFKLKSLRVRSDSPKDRSGVWK